MAEPVIAKLGSSIGGKLADLTVESIRKQIGYVISYHRNLTEHKDALDELKHRKERVQDMVDAAIIQGEEIYEYVMVWISKADQITTEAEEVRAKGRQDCSWWSCPNLWLRHQISREAKKMTIEIQDLTNKGVKFEKVSYYLPPKLVGVPPTCEENDEHIESRISIRNQVLEALRGSSSSRVGLCGLPGVGKTTLAKEMANIANEHKEIFGLVVWVTVAHNWKLESLQTQIAENAGMKLGVETVNARAKNLLRRLENENNVFVVLDDLWERLDLSSVGIPPKCKILMTSRNEELLSTHMNCQNIFTVGELSEEEAWKLFKDNAKFDESNHTELLPLAKEVCQCCGRLPLALVSVARALKNKREVDWRNARRRLEKSLGKYLRDRNKEIGPSLKLSYDYLNSELQSIFLLSAMLSHDPLIKDILKYAVGLGLLEGVQSMNDAHDTLDEDIHDLKASSLLLDSYSDDRVTMHDLFRDFAFEVQESSVVRLKGGQDDSKDKMTQLKACTTRLVLDNWEDETLPDELPCPDLEFFLLNVEGSELKIPVNFFKSLNKLRAVRFTGVEFSSLSTLGHLKELRMLCLESCAILSDIYQVGNLESLRVLSFAGSQIRELPRELRHLTCLQVLDISSCRSLEVIPPTVLSSLKKLEVLNMKRSFRKWEAEGSTKVNKNASLDELKQLKKLYDLSIRIPQNLVLPEDLFNGMPLKRYTISYGSMDRFWTDCSRNLEMSQVSLGGVMQKLLENVQYLFLSDVKVKINVLGGTLLPPHCVGLKQLAVRGCESLKAIVGSTNKDSIDDVIVFHALRTLEMADMPNLSAFHMQEEEINAKSKSLFNSKIYFPRIEKLTLRGLNRMISSIWDDDQLPENSFANLKTLEVVKCGFAGRLVPFHVLKSLRNLERVWVRDCDKVEVVFDLEELNGEEIQSPMISVPLKKLYLYNLPELKHVCSNLPQGMMSFPCLEEVEIKECERLMIMFPSTELQEECPLVHQKVVQNMWMLTCDGTFTKMVLDGQIPNNYFSNLERLSLYLDDESVIATFPHGLYQSKFPNLQTLELKGYMKELIFKYLDDEVGAPFTTLVFDRMYNLEHIWNENTQSVILLQNLQTLRVSNCDDLVNLGTSFISFTNLTEIKVSGCHKMISLLTSSASKGLVQLTKLKVSDCDQMKEVVAEQQQMSGNEIIVFQKLEYLRLDCLTSLRSFCNYNYTFKFPSLEKVMITRCPGMIMFCQGDVHTPHLKGVTFEIRIRNRETRWEGSLSKTIEYFWVSQNAKVQHLELCPEMRSLWMEQYPQRSMGFSRLEELTIDRCDFLGEFAIPTHLVRSLSITLQRLEVRNCQYIKAIFGLIMDDDGSDCFQSLQKLDISECQSLEYIFMASSVDKELEDESIEESPNFVFPHLESLRLEKLHDLKGFCPQRCTFECPQLTEIWMSQCEILKVFGTEMASITESGEKDEAEESQTPPFLAEKVQCLKLCPQRSMGFSRLERLSVDGCDFLCEFAIPTHLVRPLSINLQRLEVRNCQYIKAICGPIMDDDGSDYFLSLRELDISECKSLEYIFMTSSVTKGLEESPNFVFHHLVNLRLEKLHGLKGFCPQRCTFECPKLTDLLISQCKILKVFGTEMASITESVLGTEKDEFEDLQTPPFLVEKVIPNLQQLSLSEKDVALIKNHKFETNLFDKVRYLTLGGFFGESAAAASFPFDFLGRFPKLWKLGVEDSDFEEIFSSQPQQCAFSSSFKGFLSLAYLDQLNTIWNDDDDSLSQPHHLNLEWLEVECCPNLIKLTPSSASLANLTHLEVSGCHQLIYLFTYSTAKSLVNLFSLNVIDCKKMEEIVRNESEEDAVRGGGITFNRLWKLKLRGLPSLEGFCLKNLTFQFPRLSDVAIKGCHEMKMFSLGVSETPKLSDVKIDDIGMPRKGDLNKTFKWFFSKKVAG